MRGTMDVEIAQSTVGGRVRAPPSKSYTHRAILAAGYGAGATLRGPLISADTRATMRAVESFGGHVGDVQTITQDGSDESGPSVATLDIDGFDGRPTTPADVVDCANSGTTMRLVTATAALAEQLTVLTGDASLRTRPQRPLLDAIEQLGGYAKSTRANGCAPLVVGGPIGGGVVSIPGDVSSQFVTALLMAGAVPDAGIEIELQTELKSAPYVEVTCEVLDSFGVETTSTRDGFIVPGGQPYQPTGGEYDVPCDFSSISYLLAVGALAADDTVVVQGAHPSVQGDTAIVDILDRMGAEVEWDQDAGTITVSRSALDGITVGVGDTPDLLPTIAAVGAAAGGTTQIVDAEHVRYKETDRVSAMAEELSRLGVVVEETPESLTIHGGESTLTGARVDGRGDHRIVMALAVVGLVADGTTVIEGAEHVDVSFPGFFDVVADLGAAISK